MVLEEKKADGDQRQQKPQPQRGWKTPPYHAQEALDGPSESSSRPPTPHPPGSFKIPLHHVYEIRQPPTTKSASVPTSPDASHAETLRKEAAAESPQQNTVAEALQPETTAEIPQREAAAGTSQQEAAEETPQKEAAAETPQEAATETSARPTSSLPKSTTSSPVTLINQYTGHAEGVGTVEISEYRRSLIGKDLPLGSSFIWYESSLIVPIASPPVMPSSSEVVPGSIYIHKDNAASKPEKKFFAWQFTLAKTWKNVTESYRLDDGTVEHPFFKERVLCQYRQTGDKPSYINRESFKSRERSSKTS